jgi:hypothetical protein
MRADFLNNPRLLPYAVTLGFLGIGAMLGLVVATGRLVPIALVVGGVAGIVLLNALPLAVWLLIPGVLLVSGPVGYFLPGLSKLSWLFSLLGVFMSGAALLYAAAGRVKPTRPMPWFVITALLLAVMALVSVAFSNGSMAEISAGLSVQQQDREALAALPPAGRRGAVALHRLPAVRAGASGDGLRGARLRPLRHHRRLVRRLDVRRRQQRHHGNVPGDRRGRHLLRLP